MDSEMGDLFNLVGQYDSAFYYFSKFKNNPERTEWMIGYYNGGLVGLGYTYFMTKQYDSSLQILNEIIGSFKHIRPLILISKVHLAKKNYSEALKFASEGLNIAEKLKFSYFDPSFYSNFIDCYEILSEVYHYSGKDDLAYEYLKKYTVLKDSLENKKYMWRLNNQLNNYKKEAEEERKTSQINLLNKDNQLKEQKLKQQATVKNSLDRRNSSCSSYWEVFISEIFH